MKRTIRVIAWLVLAALVGYFLGTTRSASAAAPGPALEAFVNLLAQDVQALGITLTAMGSQFATLLGAL